MAVTGPRTYLRDMEGLRAGAVAVVACALLGLIVPAPASAEDPPVITSTSFTFVQHEFGSFLLEASPPHPYGDPCAYEWYRRDGGLPDGLEITPFAGRIRGTPTEHGVFEPLVRLYRAASEECGPEVAVDKRITVTVEDPSPVVSPPQVFVQVVFGEGYLSTPFAATGGTPPYSWTMNGAPDLAIDPLTGEISGTPTRAFVQRDATVTATDVEGDATSSRLLLNYNPNAPDLVIPFVRDRHYDRQIPLLYDDASYPPTDPVWSALATPPAGITFTADGRLVGTPTSEGTTLLPVKAFMEVEHWESEENVWYERWLDTGVLTIVVTRPPVRWVTEPALPQGRKGRSLAVELRSADGWGRHAYRVVRGAVPPGTDLVRTGRRSIELRGTPTRIGTFEFRVRVTDAHDDVRRRTFEITIRRR